MIYRVCFKIGYEKVFFDFDDTDEAIKIMTLAKEHISKTKAENALHVCMEILESENPTEGNQ